MTCDYSHVDGAYVLGALSPSDRIEFERHLPTCAECTRAVQELAGIPGLLGRVSPDILAAAGRAEAEPLPETLLPGLVARVRAAQRRRSRRLVAIAAAAVLAVSAGAVAVAAVVDDDPEVVAQGTPSEPPQRMATIGDVPLSASVSLTGVDWGTRLELTCAYEPWGDNETGPPYRLFIRTGAGELEQVASWRALPGREMSLDAATATERDDIRSVEVRTASGRPVLQLEL